MAVLNNVYTPTYGEYRAPWDEGPRKALIKLVESERLKPGSTIELGCGGRNALFLAQHKFDVTSVDCSPEVVALARRRMLKAQLPVKFIIDDLTNLQNVSGTYDVLIDYSTLDDMFPEQRDRYVENILSLTHTGSQFVLYCLEWSLLWWEKLILKGLARFGFGALVMEPGEVKQRFGSYFFINKVAGETKKHDYPRGYAVYLLTRIATL